MTEFKVFDTNTEVHQNFLQVVSEALKILEYDPDRYFQKHGFNLDADIEWYDLQKCLDMLKDIQDSEGSECLVSAGNQCPDLAIWPPEIDSIEKAFDSMDMAYHMNHRNGEIGHYIVTHVADRHIRVKAENPWPSNFDFGMCWGLAKRFAPKDSKIQVIREPSPSRVNGDEYCTYDVTW